ncbi:MAG: menaquinone-dependent protoporphyrinogen IX dehydrogenase [Brachymonas sp.]|nr:menaquinone-dependent protoporphyrinogen IX dehydrogenase [Brachymonas sp.]
MQGGAAQSPVLLAYSTTDGHTRLICERLQAVLQQQALQAEIMPLAQADACDLTQFGTLVLGASIRYGKHQPAVLRFMQTHLAVLQTRPGVFFSVNAVARKPEKNTAQTNPYVRKLMAQTPWQPQVVTALAGKIDYPRYGWLDRSIIRFIMQLTGGPTDVRVSTEFTDWSRVAALGQQIADLQRAWLQARLATPATSPSPPPAR